MARPKKTVIETPRVYEVPVLSRVPVNVDSVEAFTPETDRMVTGIFRNIECPGQPARIHMRLYKGMPIFNQVLKDGHKYTIPLSVARGIKQYCCHVKHGYLLGENGEHEKVDQPFVRYEFVAADFK